MVGRLLFFYFAAMILGSAVAVISLRSLLHSALALLVTLVHVAGLYILLNAEFIAAVQVIVYAGAILVLYLFVLMLFSQKGPGPFVHRQAPAAVGLAVVILFEFGLALTGFQAGGPGLKAVEAPIARAARVGHTETLGQVLYTAYAYPFEIASLILLVAMVGAIVLAKERLR